jgi:hypothetical protein
MPDPILLAASAKLIARQRSLLRLHGNPVTEFRCSPGEISARLDLHGFLSASRTSKARLFV